MCESRTQVVWGDGNINSDLLLIGEAPGANEDEQGKPFVGRSGQLLDRLLAEVGLDRTKLFITNVAKCRPPNNRNPEQDEIAACSPWLQAQIKHMQPEVIMTLGAVAWNTLMDGLGPLSKNIGTTFTYYGAFLVPTYHPAYALRNPLAKDVILKSLREARRLL